MRKLGRGHPIERNGGKKKKFVAQAGSKQKVGASAAESKDITASFCMRVDI